MKYLFPRLSWRAALTMLCYALVGALIAGLYGVIHDQLTYSISPEYFTKLKFIQFRYADFGFHPRVFVGEIGFLATWWVGFFAVWFLARIAVPKFSPGEARRNLTIAMMIVFVCAVFGFAVGYLLGLVHGPDYASWDDAAWVLKLEDVPAFVRVAYIHNAGYLGALAGLLFATAWLWRGQPRSGVSQPGTDVPG